MNLWQPQVLETCRTLKPDIIIADVVCGRPGIDAADALGIPVVLNFPGPINLAMNVGVFSIPDFKSAKSCCGVVCLRQTFFQFFMKILMNRCYKRGKAQLDTTIERVLLINSYWGLEKPVCHPPNFIMTGPLGRP